MSLSSLAYIGFEVSDLQGWTDYAQQVLGLMPGSDVGDMAAFRLDDRAYRILLSAGTADDVCLLGFVAEDLAAARTQLSACGIDFTEAETSRCACRGVSEMICLTDPLGLTIEIVSGLPAAEQPFVSPASVSGFQTGSQGLGHVVVSAPDIEKIRPFYTEGLGFRLSDTIEMPIKADFTILLEFFHINPRHHSLALVPLKSRKRLNHFMIEVLTLDDVGLALDRHERSPFPLTQTLGRHSNDQMVSFYARTPSGFEVEVGCDGLAVNAEDWRVQHYNRTSNWGHKRLI